MANSELFKRLARRGARERLDQIKEEMRRLDEIADSPADSIRRGLEQAVRHVKAAAPAPRPKARRLTAGQRRAISLRMRRYWQRRRRQEADRAS